MVPLSVEFLPNVVSSKCHAFIHAFDVLLEKFGLVFSLFVFLFFKSPQMLPLWWRKVTSGRASATELFLRLRVSMQASVRFLYVRTKNNHDIDENIENDTGGGM